MDDDFSADGDLESNTDDHSVADSASLHVVKNEIKRINASLRMCAACIAD
jgi:hypothetical protein